MCRPDTSGCLHYTLVWQLKQIRKKYFKISTQDSFIWITKDITMSTLLKYITTYYLKLLYQIINGHSFGINEKFCGLMLVPSLMTTLSGSRVTDTKMQYTVMYISHNQVHRATFVEKLTVY
jgi:hypothetical protein